MELSNCQIIFKKYIYKNFNNKKMNKKLNEFIVGKKNCR